MVLLHPYLLVLYVFLAATLFVHFRGRVRYPFWRQLTNYSTFLAPYNALMVLFSRVPTTPVVDAAAFPALAPLRENWQTIRDEALELVRRGEIRASERREDIAFNSFFKRDWKRFYVKWYDDVLPSAMAHCPKTAALVESIPSVNAAMFVSLAPHSRLPKHRDPFAGSLRYHLGLVTPNSDACRIEIDGEPHFWRDGEVLMFDETYIHRAENTTDRERIILFCDIARPLKTGFMTAVNRFVTRHVVKITASRNDGSEKIGFVNRVAGRLYVVRDWTKRVKRANRPLYFTIAYGLKVVLLAAVAYSVFLVVRRA
jgi:beta-hydroxylase